MSSVFPNETLRDIEVKRTRSGRVVIPPLAGWSGERIVSSLDDGAPLQYVSPTLDARAQYLLSSNMLERFKKQKLIQEPFKVEEQSLSLAEASDRSGKSAPQLKQKGLGTRQRKTAAHKTKNVGLSKSQSKLVCVELPETPQKKRIKMTVHYQMSDKLDHSDIHHAVKKNHQLHAHNDFDPSGFHKGIFEEDLIAGKQHTNTMKCARNKDCKVKEKHMHQNSSHQTVHLNIHADVTSTTVLTDQNHNLILPSSAENAGKAVRHLSVSSYEADDENSCEAGMSLEDSFSHTEDNVKHWEQQSENAKNSSHHDEISDYSQTTDMQKCSCGRTQEISRRSKATDKHGKTNLNRRIITKNNECTNDDVYGETSKITCHIQKSQQNEIVTDVSPNKTEKNCLRNQEHNRMKVKKNHHHGECHSDGVKAGKDSSLESRRHRKNISDVSKKQADVDDVLPTMVVKMSVRAGDDEHGRLEELEQKANLHSDDSCSMYEAEGNLDSSHKSPLKKGITSQSQFVGGNSAITGLSNDCVRELSKEIHATDGLKVSNVMHPGFGSIPSSKGKRAFYFALEHSVPDDISAFNDVKRKQNIKEVTTVSGSESVNQEVSLPKIDEKDKLTESDTSYSSEVSGPISKASNAVPSVKSKLKSVLEHSRQHSSGNHDISNQHSVQVVMHKKSSGNDSGTYSKNEIPIDGSYVVSETPTKNLCRQFNAMRTCEEALYCIDSETNDQNMSDKDEEPSKVTDENRNSSLSSGENSSNENFVKTFTHMALNPKESKKYFSRTSPKAVDMSSDHEMYSPNKYLHKSDVREQSCGLPSSRPVNKSVSLKENVIRRHGHICEHRPKSGLPRKSLFNPLKNQLISDVASTTFVGLVRNKAPISFDKKCSQKKRSSSSPGENLFKNEQHSTKNADCTAKGFKKRKLELFGKQHVTLSSHSVETTGGTEADVFYESSGSLAADSLSECSQGSTDAVKGSSGTGTSGSSQRLNNTFIPSVEEHENFGNQDGENQITDMNLIRHHHLDHDVHDDSRHVENVGTNKLKVSPSSSVHGIIHSQNCHVLETGLVNSNFQRSVKENGHRYHYRQKSENSRKDCDSSSLSYKISCNSSTSDGNHAFPQISNFKDSHSEKNRDLSKTIPLHSSSVESDMRNYVRSSTPVHTRASPRASEINDLGCQCKVRPEKDFKCNSVIESELVADSGVCTGYVDAFHYNGFHDGNRNKCVPENFAANIPVSCSSADDMSCSNVQQNLSNHACRDRGTSQGEKSEKLKNAGRMKSGTSFCHCANENADSDTYKSENSKKVVDSYSPVRKKLLESEIDKHAPSDFQKALSSVRCTSSAVRERYIPKQCAYTKGEGSVVVTHKNTSVPTSSGESLRAQDYNDYHKQQRGKIKTSQSVPSDSCFNSSDLESSSSDAEDNSALSQKKSNYSPEGDSQGKILHQNRVITRSYGENSQDVISQDGKNENLLGINCELRFEPDAELNSGSGTRSHKHSKNKSDALQKMNSSQNSSDAVMKVKNSEPARTGTLKRKKAVYSLRTRHSEDDECDDRRSNSNDDDVLQFERYTADESESSESTKSRRKSASPSFEFSPVYGRKALHSKKHSHNKSIRRGEAGTYLLDREQRRPEKRLEQQNVSNDLGTIHRKDDSRSGKSNKDNLFIITELQKDENNDFRISKEDVDNYYLTDEDSDTVYTNY